MADLASLIAEVLDATTAARDAKQRLETVRPLLEAEMRTSHIRALNPPGAEILITQPGESATISDMDALVEAVAEVAPTEVVTVTTRTIRPSYLAAILDRAARDGVASDPATSAVLPGVRLVAGRSSLRVTLKGADE